MISGTRYRLTMEINQQQALSRDIARTQSQISSQTRLLAPSDDPVAAARVASIQRTQSNDTVFKANLDLASALSAQADTALGSVDAALQRANELMVSGATGTLSDGDRHTIAQELRSLADQVSALKETKDSRGNRIFMSGGSLSIPVASGISIQAAGTREEVFEQVPTAAGPQDISTILTNAANALELTDPTARAAAVATSVDEVTAAGSHIADERGLQGTYGNRIDQLQQSQSDTSLQLSAERSNLEDPDLTEAIARIQSQQLTLQAAQAVFAKINSSTLFDLLG